MRIVILAAGYGTRLYPLTLNFPKPLLPVNGKPIINFLIEKIHNLKENFAIKEIKIVSNNKFYKDFLIWKHKYRIKATILNDGTNTPLEKLGAIKDIKFAIGKTKGDWFILGGDNLFNDNLAGFLKFAQKNKPYPTIGIYSLKSRRLASRFGVVMMDRQKKIIELEEKPKKPFSSLVASCIYYFPKESLEFLDSFLLKEQIADASGKYIAWLLNETKVFGYVLKGKWLDVGHYDSLRLAEKEFK